MKKLALLCACTSSDGTESPTVDCDELLNAYRFTHLPAAMRCDPGKVPDQCINTNAPYRLCTCVMPVNPGNKAAVADMERLAAEWSQHCAGRCPRDGGVCSDVGVAAKCSPTSRTCTF